MGNANALEVVVNVIVTDDDIDDIMCVALEWGINYWADRVNTKGKYRGKYAHKQISRGGKLLIHIEDPYDESDSGWRTLTKEKFLEGLKKWIATSGSELEILPNENYLSIDTSNIDAEAADTIIQYALFGKNVFG